MSAPPVTPVKKGVDNTSGTTDTRESPSTGLTPSVSRLSPFTNLFSPSATSSPGALDSHDWDAMLAANPDYDLQVRAHPNEPPKSGDWSFVHGQDTEPAKMNEPNHGKFVFFRIQVDAEELTTDVRQYLRWYDFDWSDRLSLERLNKWRTQVRSRTTGKVQEAALPWTLLEKDVVLKHVAALLNQHTTKQNLFQAVTIAVTTELKDVVQPKGSKLVSTSSRKNGEIVYKRTNPGVTKTDRTGFSRSWKTVYNKANDFHDIRELLQKFGGDGGDETEVEGGEPGSAKKRKRTPGKKQNGKAVTPKKAKVVATASTKHRKEMEEVKKEEGDGNDETDVDAEGELTE